jgi:hypothetical protein
MFSPLFDEVKEGIQLFLALGKEALIFTLSLPKLWLKT